MHCQPPFWPSNHCNGWILSPLRVRVGLVLMNASNFTIKSSNTQGKHISSLCPHVVVTVVYPIKKRRYMRIWSNHKWVIWPKKDAPRKETLVGGFKYMHSYDYYYVCSPPARWGSLDLNKGPSPSPLSSSPNHSCLPPSSGWATPWPEHMPARMSDRIPDRIPHRIYVRWNARKNAR